MLWVECWIALHFGRISLGSNSSARSWWAIFPSSVVSNSGCVVCRGSSAGQCRWAFRFCVSPFPGAMAGMGVYVPPFKLARQKAEESKKSDEEVQRAAWETLRKGINGVINKVNVANIGSLLPQLFAHNLVRGRGLFCRGVMKAQQASPGFTHIYAAIVAVVNTRLPENGELLLKRVIIQFRRAFRRRNKVCAVTFEDSMVR